MTSRHSHSTPASGLRRGGAAALALALLVGVLSASYAAAPATAAPPTAHSTALGAPAAPVTRTWTSGRSAITPAARAEINRVLATGSAAAAVSRSGAKRAPLDALARAITRCATFEGQRYCLGLGWTQATEAEAQARVWGAATLARATASRASGRHTPETTGDLDPAAMLQARAAMSPRARTRLERAELRQAARAVAKIWLIRHQIQGTPLPRGFLARHPEIRAATSTGRSVILGRDTSGPKTADPLLTWQDYPDSGEVLSEKHVNDQRRSYWCGPTTLQMIAWTKKDGVRKQGYWARRLRTTTSGTNITDMVRVINNKTRWDNRAGAYVVLDISDLTFGEWMQLIRRHVQDYRAPMVFHPILLKDFYSYLDDNASGHYQVGRGYDNNEKGATKVGFFEPWNQQRFDPSEPFIERVQWRNAYKSYRANQEHYLHNIGV